MQTFQNGEHLFPRTEPTFFDILRLQQTQLLANPSSYLESIRDGTHCGDWLCLQAAAEIYGVQVAISRTDGGEAQNCAYVLPSGSSYLEDHPTLVLQSASSGDSTLACRFRLIRVHKPRKQQYSFIPSEVSRSAYGIDGEIGGENDDQERLAALDDNLAADFFDDGGDASEVLKGDAMTLAEWRQLVDNMSTVNKAVFDRLQAINYETCTIAELANALSKPDVLNTRNESRFSRTWAVVRRLVDNKRISRQQIASVLSQAVIVARDYWVNARPKTREEYTEVRAIYDGVATEQGGVTSETVVGRIVPMLVVGFVQFGKTTNMALVCALLFDLGIKLIVLTAGRTVPLQKQGQTRMSENLNIPGEEDADDEQQDGESDAEAEETHNTIVDEVNMFFNVQVAGADGVKIDPMRVGPETDRDMTIRAMSHIIDSAEPIKDFTVFVIKKNARIVQNMIEVIRAKFPEGEEVCWMDDECDELTINNKRSGEAKFHTISKQLVANLGSKMRRCLYLGYTATAPAVLLQQKESVFFPKYFSFIGFNSPTYQGLDTFFSPQTIATRGSQALALIDFKRSVHQDPKAVTRRYVPIASRTEIYKRILNTVRDSTRQGHLTDLLSEIEATMTKDEMKRLRLELGATMERNSAARKRWNIEQVRSIEVEFAASQVKSPKLEITQKIEALVETSPWMLQFVFRALLSWSEIRLRRNRSQMDKSLIRRLRVSGISLPKTASEEFWNFWPSFKPAGNIQATGYLQNIPAELFAYNVDSPTLSNHMARSLGVLMKCKVVVLGPTFEQLLPLTKETPYARILRFQIEQDGDISACILDREDALPQEPAKKPTATEKRMDDDKDDGMMLLSAFAHLGQRILVHESLCHLSLAVLECLEDLGSWSTEKLGKYADMAYRDMMQQRHRLLRLSNLAKAEQENGGIGMPELIEVFEDGPGSSLTRIDELKKVAQHLIVSRSVSIVAKYSRRPPDGCKKLNSLESPGERRKAGLAEHWIVIGGEIFCRGITIPNLIVSLFGRVVTNQEQLLQFCRWFGHRRAEFRDLTSIICGPQQMRLFTLLWRTVTFNFRTLYETYKDLTDRRNAGEAVEYAGVELVAHPEMGATQGNKSFGAVLKIKDPLKGPQIAFAAPPEDLESAKAVLSYASDWLFDTLNGAGSYDIEYMNHDPRPRTPRKPDPAESASPMAETGANKRAKREGNNNNARKKILAWRGESAWLEGQPPAEFVPYPKQGIRVKKVLAIDATIFLETIQARLSAGLKESPGETILPGQIAAVIKEQLGDEIYTKQIDIWFASNSTKHLEESRSWDKRCKEEDDFEEYLPSLLRPYRVPRSSRDTSQWDYNKLIAIGEYWNQAVKSKKEHKKMEEAAQPRPLSDDDEETNEKAINPKKRKRSDVDDDDSEESGKMVLIVAPLSWTWIRDKEIPVPSSSSEVAQTVSQIREPSEDVVKDEMDVDTAPPVPWIQEDASKAMLPKSVPEDDPQAAPLPPIAIVLLREADGGDLQRVMLK